jgi:hypothetical protein
MLRSDPAIVAHKLFARLNAAAEKIGGAEKSPGREP